MCQHAGHIVCSAGALLNNDAPSRPRSVLAALLPAVIIFALTLILAPSVPDVDLWGHVQFGGDIVAARAIPSEDSYSFTADRPWVNHEWLAEVLIYIAYAAAGATGLTALRLTLIAIVVWLVAVCLKWSGVRGRRQITLVALVVLLTYTRTQHVRPQLFSVVLFAALLAILVRARHSLRPLWMIPALMAAWVNLHGGWIIGLATVGLWTIAREVQPNTDWRERRVLAVVLLATTLSTLVNPYGVGLWRFLWDTVGLGRPDISEWHPILRTQPGLIAFWSISVLAALVAIRRAWVKRTGFAEALIVGALAVLSFRVSRLDAFFALAVFTLMAWAFTSDETLMRSNDPQRDRSSKSLIAAAIVCALAVRWQALARIDLAHAEWLPDPDAVTFIQSRGLRGNMLTYFDWGEYAIWHLAPKLKVSMDGRRETVYTPATIDGHLAVYSGGPNAVAYVRQLNPDFVWLPSKLAVVAALRSTGEWRVIYEDPQSLVLARVSKNGDIHNYPTVILDVPISKIVDVPISTSGGRTPGARSFPGP